MPTRALHSQPGVAIMSHKQTGFANATDLSELWRELPVTTLTSEIPSHVTIESVRLLNFNYTLVLKVYLVFFSLQKHIQK